MITIKCSQCKKEIDGYSKGHAEYLMMQHKLIHRREDIKNEEKKNKEKKNEEETNKKEKK